MGGSRRAGPAFALGALLVLSVLVGCGGGDSDGGKAATSTTDAPSGGSARSSTATAPATTVGSSAATSTSADAGTITSTTTPDGSTTSTPTTQAPGTTTTLPDGTTTTESSEGRDTETSNLDSLPDGVHYGYMAGVENGTVEGQSVQAIIWDEVQFLTGDAADQAAAAAGDESPVPDDYYIVNENQRVRRLAVVPDAQVSTLGGDGTELVASSVSEAAFQDHLFKFDAQNVRGITTISSIQAVYLP